MTDKELYKMAMKENLKDPAELSAEEVRNAKGKNGYVRSNAGRYIAAAAAAAIAIGAGVFFAVRNSGKVDTAAGGTEKFEPDSIVAAEKETGSKAETSVPESIAQNDQDTGADTMLAYRKFWAQVSLTTSDYCTAISYYEGGTNHVDCNKLCWFSEDDIGQPKGGVNASEELAKFFVNAENVEYIGMKNDKECNVDTAILDRIYATDTEDLFLRGRTNVNNGNEVFAYYYVIDGTAYLVLQPSQNDGFSPLIDYYYKVTSADGKYPCWDGEKFITPDWNQCECSESSIITPEEVAARDYDRLVGSGESADGRIKYQYDIEYDEGYPIIRIYDPVLAEGVEITDGEYTIQLETNENYGDDAPVEYKISMTDPTVGATSYENGVITVDFNKLYTGLKAEDVVSYRVDAKFNTNEHAAAVYANFGSRKAYSIQSYLGINRAK